MKKTVSLLLILAMLLGTFSGCANQTDNSAYGPTGDALVMEDRIRKRSSRRRKRSRLYIWPITRSAP